MVIIKKNLAIVKDNLGELDDVIVASEDSGEEMRRNLFKIVRHFYVYICFDEVAELYTIK